MLLLSSPSTTRLLGRPGSSAVFVYQQVSLPHLQPRNFSTTTFRLDDTSLPAPSHYDVLKVSPNVSRAELKKQFYVLSKETHPDINHGDPHAAKRFAQISESYSVLADPEKRKRYDRDVMRTHESHTRHHHAHGHHHHQRGTYAGHRPPSGLSKRRSPFKGPPPSYFAQGNMSANTARPEKASSPSSSSYQAGTFNAAAFTPEGRYDPHFDASRVFRTQTHEDMRRANRRAAELAAAQQEIEDRDNFWARFVIVTFVMIFGVTVGSLIVGRANTPKGGLTRADGSRRDGARNEWTKG